MNTVYMNLISWTLVGIAIALFAGILVLEWTKPKKKAPLAVATVTQTVQSQTVLYEIPARLKAVEQKTEMAHDRLQRVETILSKIPLETVEQKLDTKELFQKINNLSDSQVQTKTEMVSLKKQFETHASRHQSLQTIQELETELKNQHQGLKELQKKAWTTATTKRKTKKK